MIITAPGYSRLHPVSLKAWTADLTFWQLRETNPVAVHCTLLVPESDD
jgi:hypothetical protein